MQAKQAQAFTLGTSISRIHKASILKQGLSPEATEENPQQENTNMAVGGESG